MEKYVCDCCGGSIDPSTLTCEYCGTKYKRDKSEYNSALYQPIRIETYHNPVNTYTACVDIDDYDIFRYGPEYASKRAVEVLSNELAKSIALNMTIDEDPCLTIGPFRHRIYGTIKMIKPVNGAEHWRIKKL